MAALRFFTRSKLSTIIPHSSAEHNSLSTVLPTNTQKRWGSFRNSSQYEDPTKYTDYKITKDPQEWEYVQRLLKPKTIPVPCLENKDYPSGWKPPVAKPGVYPYYIQRTKNYMQPVYLEIGHRGLLKRTIVRKISGDIWALETELKEYMKKTVQKPIGVRTNELLGEIQFRGDYVNLIKIWMDEKGL